MLKKMIMASIALLFIMSSSAEMLRADGIEKETIGRSAEQSQIASRDEMAPAKELEDENLIRVTAQDLKEGTYEIEVESSSSMFKIKECSLTVENGTMKADMTMGGKGYLYLYMGTVEEAAEAPEEDYIHYTEDEDGNHVYQVDIGELNQETDCAAFSKNKEKWYARTLIFKPDLLPEKAYRKKEKYEEVQASLPKKSTKKVLTVGREEETEKMPEKKHETADQKNGEYLMEVSLKGGSGKVSVTSPCKCFIDGETYMAVIEWSSPFYDYMIVDGEKYQPIAVTEEKSIFKIPVSVLDEEISVTADTTAMSEPHEIEYFLTFHTDTMEKVE